MPEDEESTSTQPRPEKQDHTGKQADLQHLQTRVLMEAAQLMFLSWVTSQPNRNRRGKATLRKSRESRRLEIELTDSAEWENRDRMKQNDEKGVPMSSSSLSL